MNDSPNLKEPRIETLKDPSEVEKVAASRTLSLLRAATNVESQDAEEPLFHWALTGGGVGIGMLREIAKHPDLKAVDWAKVHIWWGDERFLIVGDPQRNETQAREALLDQLVSEGLLPEKNIHPMRGLGHSLVLTDRTIAEILDPIDSAVLYEKELSLFAAPHCAAPAFDLLLLGMGPDGHIASLFPGSTSLRAEGIPTTGVWDSPKPPTERVSLTFETIQGAQRVWLLATGAQKAPAIAAAASGAPLDVIPANGARGTLSTVWFLDEASAYLI